MAFLVLAACAAGAHAQSPPQPGFFTDVQLRWFDSEYNPQVELAPRFVLGYDDVVGARIRYWSYDHDSFYSRPLNGGSSGVDRTLRLNFDVIDLEALTHIRRDYADVLLSGGARLAHIDHNKFYVSRSLNAGSIITESFTSYEKTDLGGLTFAAEGRTSLVSSVAAVYGGRFSILQGDWEGREAGIPSANLNLQNETFLVPEAFGGIEARFGHAFTRISVEFQEWNGRVRKGLNDASGGHDFGFTGYGIDIGWVF